MSGGGAPRESQEIASHDAGPPSCQDRSAALSSTLCLAEAEDALETLGQAGDAVDRGAGPEGREAVARDLVDRAVQRAARRRRDDARRRRDDARRRRRGRRLGEERGRLWDGG